MRVCLYVTMAQMSVCLYTTVTLRWCEGPCIEDTARMHAWGNRDVDVLDFFWALSAQLQQVCMHALARAHEGQRLAETRAR